MYLFFFFFKQKTAYEMRISDWSSDVCSSDLLHADIRQRLAYGIELERFDDRNQHFHGWAPKGVRKFSIAPKQPISRWGECRSTRPIPRSALHSDLVALLPLQRPFEALELRLFPDAQAPAQQPGRPEEHKSELQSLMPT